MVVMKETEAAAAGSSSKAGGSSSMARGCCGKGAGSDEEADDEPRQEQKSAIRTSEDFKGVGLHCYRIKQQEVATLTPLLRPRFVISLYSVLAVAFVALGSVLIVFSGKIRSVDTIRYDNIPACNVGTDFTETMNCKVEVVVTERLRAPFYVYYGLSNYHQNHRTYVNSRSYQQLGGVWPLSESQMSTCNPLLYDLNGGTEFPDDVLFPCGLTAWSRFNDTFEFCRDLDCEDPVAWNADDIAWETDRDIAFQAGPIPPWTQDNNTLITSQEFMVWMRLAAFNRFFKLHRTVTEDLEPGTYFMDIGANYPVGSFDGTKTIFITETSWFGTSRKTLGIMYLVLGGLLALTAVALLGRHLIKPRKLAYDNFNLVKEYLVRTAEEDEQVKQRGASRVAT